MIIKDESTCSTSPPRALSTGLNPVRPILFTLPGSTICSFLFLLRVPPVQFQCIMSFKIVCYLSRHTSVKRFRDVMKADTSTYSEFLPTVF